MEWINENHYQEQMSKVFLHLKSIKLSGTFERNPEEGIYYELFPCKDCRAWIVISHGFTESIVKYAEVIWYFHQAGYSVAMLEHRGHGRSFRDVKEHWLTNVNHFTDYRDDLIYFIQEVVVPRLEGQPLYVMGHSMGGGVVAHVMEYALELPVSKYVLTSPMIAPQTGGLPAAAARVISFCNALIGRGKCPIMGAGSFDKEEVFDPINGCCTSKVRFDWYHDLQCKHRMFQNSACTYHWLKEAIGQTGWILNPKRAGSVKVPVLLLQAGKDNMVKNEAQNRLASMLPDVKVHLMADAKHEAFRGSDLEVQAYMEEILSFLEDEIN